MSATYKPALLKALVRICRVRSDERISLEAIGDEFARMYWNQTVVYRLRQTSSATKESEVIRIIRVASTGYAARFHQDLPEGARAALRVKMARVLTINVLQAFHTTKPVSMPVLFSWRKGDAEVYLTNVARAFLKIQGSALEMIANYRWAEFLESCNRLVPRIIQKVSREGRRRSLISYLRILMEDADGHCFYCGRGFADGARPAIDHVVLWAFLLEDPLWDLVLACNACNSSKSDSLPERPFLDRVIARNGSELKRSLGDHVSLLTGASDLERVYEAAILAGWPRFWAPNP